MNPTSARHSSKDILRGEMRPESMLRQTPGMYLVPLQCLHGQSFQSKQRFHTVSSSTVYGFMRSECVLFTAASRTCFCDSGNVVSNSFYLLSGLQTVYPEQGVCGLRLMKVVLV